MDGVQWTCFGAPRTRPWHHGRVHGAPLLAFMSMVPRLQRKLIFLNIATPKMKIFTFKYYFFIFHFTNKNRLIDTGSSYNMPVDLFIVPHPHVHGAPRSGHHGHLLDLKKNQ